MPCPDWRTRPQVKERRKRPQRRRGHHPKLQQPPVDGYLQSVAEGVLGAPVVDSFRRADKEPSEDCQFHAPVLAGPVLPPPRR